MSKAVRIIVELFGPAFFAILPFWYALAFSSGYRVALGEAASAFVVYYGAALLTCGLQSICYTIVMEWRFSHGLQPHSWKMVSLSTALGAVSGATVLLLFGIEWNLIAIALWIGVGSMSGFLVSVVFYLSEFLKKRHQAQPGATDNPDDAQRSREDH